MTAISPVPTLAAQRTLSSTNAALNRTLERLATGERINRGADDPAGLITSENLRAVLAALDADARNLQRADHVASTADAALGEVSSLLSEAEALTVAAAGSAGASAEERAAIQMEIDSITSTVNRIASTTTFNGQNLLDGSATITAGGESVAIESVALGPVGEGEEAQQNLQAARESVNTLRGRLGSLSRHTIASQQNAIATHFENAAAAESAIRDSDFAAETAELSRLTVLQASATAALALAGSHRGSLLDALA